MGDFARCGTKAVLRFTVNCAISPSETERSRPVGLGSQGCGAPLVSFGPTPNRKPSKLPAKYMQITPARSIDISFGTYRVLGDTVCGGDIHASSEAGYALLMSGF